MSLINYIKAEHPETAKPEQWGVCLSQQFVTEPDLRDYKCRELLMPDNNNRDVSWNIYSMIENAKSLQRVAQELDKNISESSKADTVLFSGTLFAAPILLSLATEIALKAWWCRERKKAPGRIHDLLGLFNGLELSTQEMLEARMRKVSPYSIWVEQPGMQNHNSDLQEMLAAKMEPLRDVLASHKQAHTDYRYLYEKCEFLVFQSGELDRALTVIIDAYDEKWGASA